MPVLPLFEGILSRSGRRVTAPERERPPRGALGVFGIARSYFCVTLSGMRYSSRRKSGLARTRQVAKLRREAEVRRITIGGKPYEVPVVTCPEPMDCTPLESSRKPPAVLHERRSE